MLELVRVAAAGNRFALFDGFRGAPPENAGELARRVVAQHGVDGLLLLLPPEAGGAVRMVLYNADGSRPEACGNGLRVIAKIAVDRGHARGPELVVETDAGARTVEVLKTGERIASARTSLGTPHIEALDETITTKAGKVQATLIELGNPHCVVFVDDPDTAPVATLGPLLECHPRFPRRTNVAFAKVVNRGVSVRVWERGVGETLSCGTGSTAAAVAAMAHGRAASPVAVWTRGGTLVVRWTGGEARLEGPVDEPEPLEFVDKESIPTSPRPHTDKTGARRGGDA
jgi:diaminopimelate epimerase